MGTSISVTALLLGLSALPAVAQHMNAKDAPCRGVVVTAEMAACFYKASTAHNSELASLFAAVRPAVGGDELKLLDRAQVAWLEYRKLSCDSEYAMYQGGSAAPTVRFACLEALTRDRIKQLHDAYDWRVEKHQWSVEHPGGG
jgi:uncharacterized protein YecT (DUF1311 family)